MGLFNKEEEELREKLAKNKKRLKDCQREKLEYENTLEMAPLPIIRVDKDYNLQYINRAGSDFIEKTPEELKGKKCYEIFDLGICRSDKCPLEKVMKNGEKIEVETDMESIGSKEVFLECKATPVRDDGEITGSILYLRDITDEKIKQMHFRSVLDERDSPMIVMDESGSISQVNSAAEDYFEMNKNDMLDRSYKQVFQDLGFDLTKVVENGEETETSLEIDGDKTKYFLISSIVLNGTTESSKRLLEFKDITDKKELEKKLEDQRNRQETLVENAPVSISITDLDDNLMYVNEYMADKFGYTKEELEGKNLSELTTEEEFKKLQRKTEKRKDGESETYELKFTKKDGSSIEALISATPFENDEGEVVKTAGFIQDITEIKQLQREQQEAKKYLERQVEKILEAIERVENGNMTVTIEKEKDDHIGRLIDGLNNMISEFRNNLEEIQKAADELNNASETIASSSEELNAVSENVSDSVEDITKKADKQADQSEKLFEKIEHSAANMEETSASAENINKSTKKVADQTEDGKKFAQKAAEGVQELQEILDNTSEKVASLDKKSEKIGDVIDTISDIAEQTNLLALNAAIEAARAGEEGKGFAVVADSVRELAEETQEETDNIKEIIEETQTNTSEVVKGVDEVIDKTEDVGEVTQMNLDSLEEIKESIDSISDSIQEISKSVEEVTDDLQDSSDRVESVANLADKHTDQAESVSASAEEQNSSVEELSTSAQQLSNLANELSSLVDKYEL